jgi:hypothetical protein
MIMARLFYKVEGVFYTLNSLANHLLRRCRRNRSHVSIAEESGSSTWALTPELSSGSEK